MLTIWNVVPDTLLHFGSQFEILVDDNAVAYIESALKSVCQSAKVSNWLNDRYERTFGRVCVRTLDHAINRFVLSQKVNHIWAMFSLFVFDSRVCVFSFGFGVQRFFPPII